MGYNPFRPSILYIIVKYGAHALLGALSNPGKDWSVMVASVTMPYTQFGFDEVMQVGLMNGVNYAREVLSSVAFLAMLLTSVGMLSLLNLSYFLGLLVVRVEIFMREKYGYDQTEILKSPVEYLGRVVCVVATIIVVALSALVFVLTHNTENGGDFSELRNSARFSTART